MIYADFFLRNQETYLCITQEDVPEVKEQIFAEKRIALEIGAVVVLPCFPVIQKLILLPGGMRCMQADLCTSVALR